MEECEYTNWQKRNEKLLVHLDKPVSRLLTCQDMNSFLPIRISMSYTYYMLDLGW